MTTSIKLNASNGRRFSRPFRDKTPDNPRVIEQHFVHTQA